MTYELKPTRLLIEQIKELDNRAKEILKEKFELLKENPSRNKQLRGYPHILFRIRFSDNNKSKRLIYCLKGNRVILLCILDRDKGYDELSKYIKKFEKQEEL